MSEGSNRGTRQERGGIQGILEEGIVVVVRILGFGIGDGDEWWA